MAFFAQFRVELQLVAVAFLHWPPRPIAPACRVQSAGFALAAGRVRIWLNVAPDIQRTRRLDPHFYAVLTASQYRYLNRALREQIPQCHAGIDTLGRRNCDRFGGTTADYQHVEASGQVDQAERNRVFLES